MIGPGTDGRGETSDPYEVARERMVETQLRRRGVVIHSVLEAMRIVPRHLFVDATQAGHAYADEALPSLEGQTISQPFMVAMMLQELALRAGQRVLEIGTGTGYQTALLTHLVRPEGLVCTIERVPALAEAARRRLEAMHILNVRFFVGDGTLGWPPNAQWTGPRTEDGQPQFDRITVTAGGPRVPEPLIAQLAGGGVMVVPVGTAESQVLVKVTRVGSTIEQTPVMACRFVPLVGSHGWTNANRS